MLPRSRTLLSNKSLPAEDFKVFLSRCLSQVAKPNIFLFHESRAWYLWTIPCDESVHDSLSQSEIRKGSRPQRNVADYHAHIVAKLCGQGLSAEAAEEMLRTRWSQSGKNNIAAGWRQWHEYCLDKNAAAVGDDVIDVLTPTPCQLVDFLRVVRKGLRREGEKNSVGTSANWVRAIRSHVSTTCTL